MNEKPSVNVSIGNYVDIVRRRLWTAANTFVIATTVGVVATFLAASVYQTRARILIKPIMPAGQSNDRSSITIDPPNSIETQIQLLQSNAFLLEMMDKARIPDKSSITRVTISQVGATNLIDIEVEGTSASSLQALANTMATNHLQREQDNTVLRLKAAEDYLSKESKRALTSVGTAEAKLTAYRRLHPGVDQIPAAAIYGDRDLLVAQSQLRAAELSISHVQRRIEDARARIRTMPDTVVRTVTEPNHAADEAIASLGKLNDQKGRLLRLYPPANPKIRALDSQIADLEDAIKSQPRVIKRQITDDNADKKTLVTTLAQLELQLADAKDNRDSLAQQASAISATAHAAPQIGPTVDKDLMALQRDLDTATRQYMVFHDKLQDVQIMERAIQPSSADSAAKASDSKPVDQAEWGIGRLVDKAVLPGKPIRPQRGFLIVASVLAALVLSLSLVFMLEYFDDSLKWPEELEWYTGVSILGYSPTIDDPKNLLITKAPTYSVVAERYRLLRANVQFATVDSPLRSMLITSGIGGEGKSLVAANLAAAFALEGRRVILIDADMRKPSQHDNFGLKPSPGLSELLDGVASLRDCVQETGTPNLYLIGAGQPKGNPAEMIGSRLVDMLLNELKPYCDLVIFDAPPCLAVADASLLSAKTDATLLVVDFSRAKRHVIRQSMTVLARARAKVIGAVLNRVDNQRRNSYYGYGYYYAYPTRALPEGEQPADSNGNGARTAALARLPGAPESVESLPDRPFGAEDVRK